MDLEHVSYLRRHNAARCLLRASSAPLVLTSTTPTPLTIEAHAEQQAKSRG